jgi:hypothetical protein
MRHKMRPVGVSPLARLIRRLRPDRNPLRRATDRAETAIVAVLVGAFLIGAPVAAVLSAHRVSAAGLRAEQTIRYKVHATLLENSLGPLYSPYGPVSMPTLARWTAPDGSVRTGLVADPGGRAGGTLTIWTNETGRRIGPAPPRGLVTARAAMSAAAAVIFLGVVLLVVGMLALDAVNRRKLAAWDAAWQVVGPQWTRPR